jgi:murein DD-endopeptidase MepM/ murein hydrolase activator NlpD
VVTDDPVPVAQRDPIILTPPLRGDGWVDGNGCCKQIGPHRGFFSAIDGALWPAEEFAIDFVRINAQGVGFTGDPNNVKSYFYYGDGVFAAGAGTVTEVVSDLPDQIPNNPSIVTTEDTAAGNHVIIDMGEGRYALYAHLQPNSPTVQVGDSVYQGQRLGLLGNSGNTTAPHLHFEIMDRPNALKAHGLPFVFDNMRLEGEFAGSMDQFGNQYFVGIPLKLDRSHNGSANGAMPLTLGVFGFK